MQRSALVLKAAAWEDEKEVGTLKCQSVTFTVVFLQMQTSREVPVGSRWNISHCFEFKFSSRPTSSSSQQTEWERTELKASLGG